jgi:hypothetical protein
MGLYSPRVWGRFRSGWARSLIIVVMVLIYLFPFSFVFWRVATWQFPFQRKIDQATFNQVQIALKEQPMLTALERVIIHSSYSPSPVALSAAQGLGVGGPEILRYAQNDTA